MTPEKAQALLGGAIPGPWDLREWGEDDFAVDGGEGFFYPVHCDEHEGNARLIAAAPDLARAYIAQAKQIEAADKLAEAATAVDDFMRTAKAYERSGYGPKMRAALTAYEESKK